MVGGIDNRPNLARHLVNWRNNAQAKLDRSMRGR